MPRLSLNVKSMNTPKPALNTIKILLTPRATISKCATVKENLQQAQSQSGEDKKRYHFGSDPTRSFLLIIN